MVMAGQKRMASDMLKCGLSRIWIDPDRVADVEEAITRSDIRALIKDGAIKKLRKKGISRGRKRVMKLKRIKGRRRGPGTRSGTAYARFPRKRRWIQRIRPQRALLKKLRVEGKIDRRTYSQFYRYAGSGMFKSKAHLEMQLRQYVKTASEEKKGV